MAGAQQDGVGAKLPEEGEGAGGRRSQDRGRAESWNQDAKASQGIGGNFDFHYTSLEVVYK